MKINAINNTNFKGYFHDPEINSEGWNIKYSPYSWETPKANKQTFSVYDSYLPMNEEIYKNILGNDIIYESSKDILGTESYLKDIRGNRDILHRNIVDCPNLNLEESLKVLDKKYAKFLIMKRKELEELYTEAQKRYDQTSSIEREHNKYVFDVTKGWGSHQYDKDVRADGLREGFNNLKSIAQQILNKMAKSKQLTDSIFDVYEAQKWIKEELEKIALAKANNQFVDLSNASKKTFEEFAENAIKNIAQFKEKLVTLPNGTVSFKEFMPLNGNCTKEAILERIKQFAASGFKYTR